MKNFFSTMITALCFVVLIFIGTAFIEMEFSVFTARAFHSNVIDRVQSSLYSEDVIEECMNEAEERGYVLSIEDVTVYDERKDVKVTLQYSVSLWMSDEAKVGTFVGYAR